jgi:DTW domain-containing protein YfiP
MALREAELAKAQRAFFARGSRVVRCSRCLLPSNACICKNKPVPVDGVAVAFIMYKGEYYKPTNTGRLIADVIKDNHAFLWNRTEPDKALIALLNDKKYEPILVFPHQYAAPERCINEPTVTGNKTLLFIFLDGTWREARKMFGKSPYLNDIPVLGVDTTIASDYLLREATHAFQQCTAEVAVSVLALANQPCAAQNLANYFSIFRHQYLKGKPHLSDKLAFAKAQLDK